MEEEELYADFKKHLNVDFGDEYEEENLRSSLPRKSLEHNENYIADNLEAQLNGYEENQYEEHEDQPIGRNYSDVSDGPVGFYQERRQSSVEGQVFNYGNPDE